MLRPLALALCLSLAAAPAIAADPPASVEDLVARILDLRKQEQAARDQLDALLKKQRDALDKLGPPGPGPGPTPLPPAPPPKPADLVRAKLKAALDADGAPAELKREQARDLAALYRAAAKLAEDPAVATAGELLRRVRDAAGTLVGPDALREVRRVGGNELAELLPADATLGADQRAAVAGTFRKLAALLEELAP